MKKSMKLLCIALIIVISTGTLISAAADEIFFRDIPWLIYYDQVIDILSEEAFNKDDFSFPERNGGPGPNDETGKFSEVPIEKPLGAKISSFGRTEVAGYWAYVYLYFAMDPNDEAIQSFKEQFAKYKDIYDALYRTVDVYHLMPCIYYMASYKIIDLSDGPLAYNDLCEKLTELYGDYAIQDSYREEPWDGYPKTIEYKQWTGDNSTRLTIILTHFDYDLHDTIEIYYSIDEGTDYLLSGSEVLNQLERQLLQEGGTNGL